MKISKKTLTVAGIATIALTVVTTVLAVVPTALAEAGPKSGPAMAGMHGFFQSLSADQQAAIRKLSVEHEKKAIALRADLQTKQLDLYTLITGDADESKIDAKIEEIGKIRTDLEKQRMALDLGIRKQLTAEQKAKFDARFMHRGGRSPAIRGGGRHCPMPAGGGPE